MNFKTARDLLELPNNFSLKQLKKNYHTKALKTHPDKCKNDTKTSNKFKEINEAYSYLLTYLSVISDQDREKTKNNETTSYKDLLCSFLNITKFL